MELFSLFSHRALSAAPNSVHLKPTSRERPMASGLARAQVADGQARIATARHTSLDLDSFAARLIHYLDGASTEAELTRLLLTDLANGTLIPPDGTKMQQWSAETREKKFRQSCSELLNLFSRQGILL